VLAAELGEAQAGRLASETTVNNDAAATNADGGYRNGDADGHIISPHLVSSSFNYKS
jgi:hypothetical protein